MAKIKIEEIIDYLDSEMRRALEATIKDHFPDQEFDTRSLFRTFKSQVYRKCETWKEIPSEFIER